MFLIISHQERQRKGGFYDSPNLRICSNLVNLAWNYNRGVLNIKGKRSSHEVHCFWVDNVFHGLVWLCCLPRLEGLLPIKLTWGGSRLPPPQLISVFTPRPKCVIFWIQLKASRMIHMRLTQVVFYRRDTFLAGCMYEQQRQYEFLGISFIYWQHKDICIYRFSI